MVQAGKVWKCKGPAATNCTVFPAARAYAAFADSALIASPTAGNTFIELAPALMMVKRSSRAGAAGSVAPSAVVVTVVKRDTEAVISWLVACVPLAVAV